MSSRLRAIVTTALIAMLALAVPTAAHASSIYPPVDSCQTSTAAVTLGEAFTFSCEAGTFAADEPVTVTITGENATSASFGFIRFAVSTLSNSYTSTSSGSLEDVRITLPTDGSGIYNIAAVSATSAGGTSTGFDGDSLLGIWIGGGALVLGGAAIAVGATVRRNRQTVAA